jgi:hypothetical protein
MLPAIGRAVFLGGGLFGNALGGAIKGIGSAVGGIAQGAGSAVGGIAQGIGSAVGGVVTPAPKVIVNNVGIAGEAGKKKITGSGTLPAPKKSARPTVNANMPTEKLLVVAVNYLSSIDKTLQDQLKFESQAFNQQVQAERESSIENKKTGVFTKLSDKFGGLLKTGEDSTMKSRAGDITKVILGATGLAALGALGLAGMGDTELARLKTSWSAFTEKYAWLTDLASAVTGAGSFIGYLVGGLRGAVFGMIADWMLQRLTGSSIGNTLLGAMGIGGSPDATAATAREPNTGFDYAMGAVVAGYGAMRGVKTYKDVTGRMSKITAQRAAPRVMASGGRLGFRDPITGKVASKAASSAGGSWLSGPKGRKFVAFLSKRFGKTWLAKVIGLMGRVFAGVAVAATGVGAIPGILWTLINIGLSIYTVYDLLDAWWDFQDEEAASKDAAAANSAKPSTDASPATSNIGSGNIAGAPVASAEQMQNLPTIPADIEKILATIRTRESGGNYGIPHPIEMPGQTASGAYAFTNDSWQGLTKKYGIGTEYSSAYLAPPPIQDAVAAKYVEEILQKAGGDVSKVPLAWYTGNIQGKISAKALAVNNGLTPQEYQAKWMSDYTGGKYAASSYDSQGAGSSGLAAGAMDLGKGLIESVGSIISAGLGPMSGRSTSASLSSMSSTSTPRPPSSLPATPMSADTTKVSEIAQASAKIQSAIDLGNPKSNPADQMPTNSVQASLRNASSDSKLESIDPNYPGGSDDYLKSQLYRMAA